MRLKTVDEMCVGGRSGKAGGGAVDNPKIQVYNAKDSEAVDSAMDQSPGFKKGGHKKRKDGGVAVGLASGGRADRAQRGGHFAKGGKVGGGSPYSSGRSLSMGKGDSGKEGVKVPAEMD